MLLNKEMTTIRDLIDRCADAQPDLAFLISPETGHELTFKALQRQARQLCARFHGMGLAHGDKIAFLMDNGLCTAQLFLGTMYGGFVTVPLNVRAGVAQLAYTLEHCDAKIVFVGRHYDALIKDVLVQVRRPVEVISADAESGLAASEAPVPTDAWPPLSAGDAAMLIYTSGSTGQPKGALHTHRSLLAHGRNSLRAHHLTAADRSLLVLPLYHINAECVTLIPTLMSGGSVVLPRGFAIAEFWNWMEDYRCTWSAVVPTIISQLLDWKDPEAASRAATFQRIRFLRSSSAPLSPSLQREFIDKFKLPLLQAMGSSEAGNVFSNPVPPGVNKIGSPGLPWGFEAKIVDREGAELPEGEPGEVWLRGEGMMQGYYNDPAGTAAALDAAGWLHTGDLAYRDEDGYFFVIGRSKELIIKGGVNIAPKQVDEILETHPAVLEAAAVGVPDRYVGEDLVAFAVLRDGMHCDERELLSFCESHLGYFKTPARIYFVADLPKGPSGKVQRLRLTEEAERLAAIGAVTAKDRAGSSTAHAAGAEDGGSAGLEQIIVDIWTDLLGQPHIGPDSNFFALGGQSLQAIQCLSQLRERASILLSLSDFFENATVAQLAALVRRRRVTQPAQETAEDMPAPADLQPIPVRDPALPCPLSLAQERVWFMEQIKAEEPAYNEAEAVRLKGKLDVAALEQAFNIMIGRHEILRTTIEARDGRPTTIIHEAWHLKFKKINLRHLAAGAREAELARLLITEPRLPYRLDAEPAVRVTIVQIDDEDHAFIMMLHHIVCDSASLGILWRELVTLYDAALRGVPSPLPPLPIQYGDYAVWQRQPAQQERFDADLAYWKEKLLGAPPLLDQPTDRVRPPVFSFRGTKRQFAFDPALASDLRQLCRKQRISLFTLFAAAFNTIMHRYTGQDDILVGIPIADRERPELRPLIGFLLDTHVLRTDLSGDPTFRALMGQVQQNVAGVYSHRAVPFDQVVSALKPERNQSYSPLVQVMLNWRDRDDQPQFIGLPGLVTEALLAQPKIAKFDLALTLDRHGNEIQLETEYSTDLFDEDRIERLAGHLRTLLEGVVANVEQRLSALPILTRAERDQLLYAWNATQAVFPADKCVHELFEAQVAKSPDAIAVIFEDQQLSYAELNRRANQLAHHLRTLGVEPDARVALCLERGCEMIVGLLAILKAGGAYVPLDPAYPAERLAFMIEDSTPQVLLTQRAVQPAFGHLPDRLSVVVLDDNHPPWAACPATNPEPASIGLTISSLAYIIYTSGSTGTPKGVLIEHRALVQHCVECREFYGLTSEDRVLQFASLSFDAAIEQIIPPLLSGARVVLREAVVWDACKFQQKLAEFGLTVINLPPAYWQQLAEGWANAVEPVSAHQLRLVIIGGDAMSIQTLKLWQQTPLNNVRLLNAYGPTEAVITATSFDIPARNLEHAPRERIPIGRPRGARQIYVLDRWSRLAPVGVPGELHIGGSLLARGYHNRAALTTEKFIIDPFANKEGARLYRTGDLARYLPDGTIEFLGRLDHQVKIRGFRIELGEIEAALAKHPAVREVVVLALGEDSEKRLAAYVVADSDDRLASSLRAHLVARMPEYMVPAAFVRLDRFPLTPNGKLDRRALPTPDDEGYAREAYEAPQGEVEIALAAIWGELLGVERISRNDNFFELGGHSLMAIQVLSRIRRRMDVSLKVRDIFEKSQLYRMAEQIVLTQLSNYDPAELAAILDQVA